VVELKLLLRYIAKGAEPVEAPVPPSERDEDAPLVFAY
jgi:cytochrome d ubiquinol oxidase subunit I